MKIIPLLIIGSKQANAYIGSTDDWCSCITAACGLGGGANTYDSRGLL